MNVNMRSHNYEPSDKFKATAKEKVEGLSKYIDDIKIADVEFTGDTHHNKGDVATVEITLHLYSDGKPLRADHTGEDMGEALDIVIDKLKKVIEGYKGKRNKIDRKAIREMRDRKEYQEEEGEMGGEY